MYIDFWEIVFRNEFKPHVQNFWRSWETKTNDQKQLRDPTPHKANLAYRKNN